MGKHKRVRRPNRGDPLARKTAQDEKTVKEKILPLLDQLKSVKPAERAVAIGAMNAMADDPNLRSMLLKEKALQTILSHTLTDSSQEITSESYGFLRNVVLEEGRDVAMFLFRQNVLATLTTAAQKLYNAWDVSLETLKGQDRATVLEFAENLLGLLSGMALADDAIYDSIVTNLAEISISLAKKALLSGSNSTADAALEFLYVLSEENPEVAIKLRELPFEAQTVSSKVYSLGIQYNLHEVTNGPLLPILEGLVAILSSVDASKLENVGIDNIKDPSELKAATLKMLAVRSQINAIQVSLELFGAITESLVDGSEPAALEYIRDAIIPLCLGILDRPEFIFRAISAVNNIGWTLDATGAAWEPAAEQIWAKLEPLVSSEDIDTATAVVGVLGAVAKLFGGAVPVKAETVDAVFARCASLKTPELKEEYLQFVQPAIVLLATISAAEQNSAIIPPLTDLLLEIIRSSSEVTPPLLMEVIDALFELFGDNDAPSQSVYVSRNINQVLKDSLPTAKRVLKSVNKSANPGLWEQANETLLNLTRFIEYKN